MTDKVPPVKEKFEFSKGRGRALSDDEVWVVRRRYLGGASKYALAKEFGVSRTTIYAAVHGEKAYEGV